MEQEIKFEKALERLEKVVEDLESGNVSLEDALKKYEEGVKLSRLCTERLKQAETKIETLTRALNGTLEAGPLEREEGAKKSQKKTKKPERAGESDEDELLL